MYKTIFTDVYNIEYDYWPSSNEKLEDCAANNKLVRGTVFLVFRIWKSYKASKPDPIILPKAFAILQTLIYSKPHKYNELEYQIDTLELQMEFYLRMLKMFYKLCDSILSIFGGGKVLCAGLVSILRSI